jgi:hypothetical protein
MDNLSQFTGKSEKFRLWLEKIFLVVELASGKNSPEYKDLNEINSDFLKKYEDSFSASLVPTEDGGARIDNISYDENIYKNALIDFKTKLKSIIQRYEIVSIKIKPVLSFKKSLRQKIWQECKDIFTSIAAKFAAEKTKGA